MQDINIRDIEFKYKGVLLIIKTSRVFFLLPVNLAIVGLFRLCYVFERENSVYTQDGGSTEQNVLCEHMVIQAHD